MASELRYALRQTLTTLQTQLCVDGAQSMEANRGRAHKAEISSIFSLLRLSLSALTGECLVREHPLMTCGDIRDCQDIAALGARELHALRQETDAELHSPPVDLPREAREIVQEVLASETAITVKVEKDEKEYASLLEKGLETCSSEMCTALCDALAAAAPDGTQPEERERIGREAASRLKRVSARWLAWYVNAETSKKESSPVAVSSAVTIWCMEHAGVAKYVKTLRRCMHLRRQQARVLALMQRLAAAVKVCDACSLLRRKIVFVPGGLE